MDANLSMVSVHKTTAKQSGKDETRYYCASCGDCIDMETVCFAEVGVPLMSSANR
jgi:hypothetical protein